MKVIQNKPLFKSRIITPCLIEKKKNIYIQNTKKWLQEYAWDYFLTLTFKHPIYDEVKVSSAIHNFINELSGLAFGGRSQKRIKAFSSIERNSSDNALHVHMIIQDPFPLILNENRRDKFDIRDSVIKSWLKSSSSAGNPALTGKADEWMKEITDIEACVGYMLKEVKSNLDNSIVWDQLSLTGKKSV